jgi:hypothetical protein
MGTYGWTNYDPRTGGSQAIEDSKGNLRLTTELLKESGGNWRLRIRGVPITGSMLQTIAIFYIGSESPISANDTLACRNDPNQNRSGESIAFHGSSSGLGSFKLLLEPPRSLISTNEHGIISTSHKASVASMSVLGTTVWKAKGW